jgi:cytochrome c551/c552
LIFLAGCSSQKTEHYDGKVLLEQQCARCHNLDMPPKTYKDEKAPPIMAVAFHIKDFMPVTSPADKRPKFIEFVSDYALNPRAEKSFCDKESLQSYGVMPSLKGRITRPELEAVAAYIFDTYTKEIFLKKMQEANAFAQLPKGEQLARKEGCFGCHDTVMHKVGPSFQAIAERYGDSSVIAQSIRNGSRGKWEKSRNIPMPAFKQLDDNQTQLLLNWISRMTDNDTHQ